MQSIAPSSVSLTEVSHKGSRIQVVDVLRGFALFGIIINHFSMNYLAGFTPAEYANYNIFGPVDRAFDMGSFVFTFGKFYTIFSFLFGLSFAIQLQKAIESGASFTGRFIWRLVTLFLIGYAHNLFFSGDILVIYAVLGLVLVVARPLGDKLLLFLSILLILNTPLQVQRVKSYLTPAPAETQQVTQEQLAAAENRNAAGLRDFETKLKGSAWEVAQMNAVGGLFGKLFFQLFTGRIWITTGLFLLGLYAGRKKLFIDTSSNRRLFHRLTTWGGAIALACMAFGAYLLIGGATIMDIFVGTIPSPILSLLGSVAFDLQQISLSCFYVGGVVLLYWSGQTSHRVLHWLAPVGQMGLTTYLVQSVFGLLLFYGFGLGMMDKIGVATSIGIATLLFGVQILMARWWLSRFRLGPVEWFWRSLTYLKVQPLRKRQDKALVPVAQ